MSFNIRAIREIPNDPMAKFATSLGKKLSKFLTKDQVDKLENKEDIFSDGQDLETVVRFHGLLSSKTFDFETQFFPPTEPDGNKLRLWIRGHNMGNTSDDWSEKGNVVNIRGDPLLVDGTPFDDGIHTAGVKSVATRFNTPNIPKIDYIRVDASSIIRASEGLSTGVSFFIRFRVFDLAQESGVNRTLFEKTDNNPVTDGVIFRLTSTGRLEVLIKNTNIEYAWQTATGTITTNTVYDVWLTYNKSGNAVHIYVNNVDKTLSAGSITSSSFHSDTADFDFYIFRRAAGSTNGLVYGDLYDFREYREKVVSSTEVSRMFTNKWTIANIPFGQVMVTNYFATYAESPSLSSFTSTSFSSTSFTA